MGLEKLFIDTTTNQGHHRDLESLRIHVVYQIDQNLFGTARPQIMNKKQYFFQMVSLTKNVSKNSQIVRLQ